MPFGIEIILYLSAADVRSFYEKLAAVIEFLHATILDIPDRQHQVSVSSSLFPGEQSLLVIEQEPRASMPPAMNDLLGKPSVIIVANFSDRLRALCGGLDPTGDSPYGVILQLC